MPACAKMALRDLVSDIRTANQRVHEQANYDVRKRLCAELIRLSRNSNEGRTVVLTAADSRRIRGAHQHAPRGDNKNVIGP